MTIADMMDKHKIRCSDNFYRRPQFGRILAGKDIFWKKRQFKAKNVMENTVDSKEKFDSVAKKHSLVKSPGQTRSKSLKRNLSFMNSSTVSSIAAKKLRESRGSPNAKVIWHNKSLEKSQQKESSCKKRKSDIKLTRSMSVLSTGVSNNKLVPSLMATFSKKRSVIGLIEKPGADIISGKRSKAAIIPKGLISSATLKKFHKIDPKLASLSQCKLKKKKTKTYLSDEDLDKSTALLDYKMADLKSKLELFFKAHELLKLQIANKY